ncbi:MAG: peptidylprolyl isomerase [Xanthomonadales bacterium]|nr:peptidylprolyl isomerase [Xanthomonadales bacterium]
MSKWLKEPLVHFLLLGAVIFFVYGLVAEKGRAENEIFISRGQQENLVNTFSRTWQRLPTPVEYQGLLKDYIRQEIAYRQSREMGLDQDDIVIRRRLRQKMEMLAEDVAGLVPPTEEDLQAYLDGHTENFMIEPRMSLQQIYFSSDRRGERAAADAQEALQNISGQGAMANTEALGDPLPLPAVLDDAGESEIARLFGSVFVEGLRGVEAGSWTGPVASGFGLHLVLVMDRRDGRVPVLDEVRPDVLRELMNQQRQDSVDGLYEKLAENYSIEIEPLIDTDAAGTGSP